jgi:hypothetical protein
MGARAERAVWICADVDKYLVASDLTKSLGMI